MTITQTLGQMLAESARRNAKHPAQRVRIDDTWQVTTYAELHAQVRALSAALIARGLDKGERLALLAPNVPQWSVVDFATVSAGGILVPIFSTSTPEQAAHVVADSGAKFVVAHGAKEVDTIIQGLRETEHAPQIFTIEHVDGYTTLADLIADKADEAELDRRLGTVTPDDPCTIIYTSGTTGQPRGAVHAHRSFTYQLECFSLYWDLGPGDSSIAFLPLAHAFERVWTYYVLTQGGLNTYSPNPRKIAELLVLAKPNYLISVPKLYEKVYATAKEKIAGSPLRSAIFNWAIRVGGRAQHQYRKGATPAAVVRAQLRLADKLVLGSIRDAMGGPKKLMISGGAPLRQEIEEFFSATGLLLGQGYGLTETGPVCTFFGPETFKLGTVGYPLTNSQMKLGADSELLYKGPNIMQGYWKNPEATAEAIDADGWFHTGDVGYIDNQGYVVITDRKKDIIITSGGKNVAPQSIEGLFASDPFFEYAVVLGDNRPYLTMLVQPSIQGAEDIARQLSLGYEKLEDLWENQQVVEEVKRRVNEVTAKLPSFEQIRDLRLVGGLTNEEGLVTPTFKVRRKAIEAKFADLIDDMYSRVRTHSKDKA